MPLAKFLSIVYEKLTCIWPDHFYSQKSFHNDAGLALFIFYGNARTSSFIKDIRSNWCTFLFGIKLDEHRIQGVFHAITSIRHRCCHVHQLLFLSTLLFLICTLRPTNYKWLLKYKTGKRGTTACEKYVHWNCKLV